MSISFFCLLLEANCSYFHYNFIHGFAVEIVRADEVDEINETAEFEDLENERGYDKKSEGYTREHCDKKECVEYCQKKGFKSGKCYKPYGDMHKSCNCCDFC